MTTPYDATSPLATRSAATVTVDNLIRRALRVSDPTDPGQLARALLDRYKGDADQLARERTGSPLLTRDQAPPALLQTGERPELAEARADLDRDLDALVSDSKLKDIAPEMRGWSTAIRAAATSGLVAARLALDPAQRDRALAARRTLSDYSRLARYMAALAVQEPGLFCSLAQSCDIMGHLILVLAGEALAEAGVTRTSVILQAPGSDLQIRREAALGALRGLTGAAREAQAPNEWPRALTALRQLHRELTDSGASDLRAFLDESYLGGVFDEMIALTAGGRASQMRALGATSVVTVAQLERFLMVCQTIARPESPQLATFLNAIQYFVQAFSATRAGYRLVYVARPPLLFYGLYGTGGPDVATARLMRLIALRGEIAERLDCLCCGCDDGHAVGLVIGGKALYDIDRGIDLLAMGVDPAGRGSAELRAVGLGYVVRAAARPGAGPRLPKALAGLLGTLDGEDLLVWDDLFTSLTENEATLRADSVNRVLCAQKVAEARWRDLVASMSSICRQKRILGISAQPGVSAIDRLLGDATTQLGADLAALFPNATLAPCPEIEIRIPQHFETAFEGLVEDVTLTSDGRSEA